MNSLMCVVLLQIHFILVNAIWPPPYKVNLKHEEEFVIGEYIESDENDWFNAEDEMIPANQIRDFQLERDEHKFVNLHNQVKRFNDKQKTNNDFYLQHMNLTHEENENYSELLDPEPWNAGFVDKNNNFITNQENRNVVYSNIMSKRMAAQTIHAKRDSTDEAEYNYEELNNEYKMAIQQEKQMNDTFNATLIRDEEETIKGALDKIVDFKTVPRNCTEEEITGIGFAAVKCVWLDLQKAKTSETRWQLFIRIKRICLIWFCIYLVIAIPCWCHKGWCCCCFRCKFCRPRSRINEAKKYMMDNPPGTFVSEDKKTINYKPTVYENDAYEKLKKILMQL